MDIREEIHGAVKRSDPLDGFGEVFGQAAGVCGALRSREKPVAPGGFERGRDASGRSIAGVELLARFLAS